MSAIKANIGVSPQDVFSTSATQGTDLGALATTGDGRYYRYCLAGGTTLVPGKLQQSTAESAANWEDLAVTTTAAVGATQLVITTSTTNAANVFAGGMLITSVPTTNSYGYGVKSNTASSAGNMTVNLSDPLLEAVTSSVEIDIVPNLYSNIVVAPVAASLTGAIVGVAQYAITNAQYGWVQTHGLASVLVDDAGTVGLYVTPSDTVGGAVTTGAITANTPTVGWLVTGVADTEYGAIFLTID